MNLLQAILMGIVQGLSEFLPVSSSGHLVFTSNFYKIFSGIEIIRQSNEEIFFDIMLHFGTLIAVLIFFRKDIINICSAVLHALKNKDWSGREAKLGLYILSGTFVTFLLALPLHGIAAALVFKPQIVGVLLCITGLLLFASEYFSKNISAKKTEIDLKTSIVIGLVQGLAVLPGFSRSGWTIAAGLFSGLDRIRAAKYSFLLSIPVILASSLIYPLVNTDIREAFNFNWAAIIAGTFVSGITGYLCIKYFMRFVSKFSLGIFGYYCFIAGSLTAVYFNLN